MFRLVHFYELAFWWWCFLMSLLYICLDEFMNLPPVPVDYAFRLAFESKLYWSWWIHLNAHAFCLFQSWWVNTPQAYHSEWIQLMFIPMDSPQWIHSLLMNVLHAYLSLYMRSSFLIPWISLECHTWCQCFESRTCIYELTTFHFGSPMYKECLTVVSFWLYIYICGYQTVICFGSCMLAAIVSNLYVYI